MEGTIITQIYTSSQDSEKYSTSYIQGQRLISMYMAHVGSVAVTQHCGYHIEDGKLQHHPSVELLILATLLRHQPMPSRRQIQHQFQTMGSKKLCPGRGEERRNHQANIFVFYTGSERLERTV
jgi:hypothetical protein